MIGGLKMDTGIIMCIILGILVVILLILVILFGVAYKNADDAGLIKHKNTE